jgi:hypothetical protein
MKKRFIEYLTAAGFTTSASGALYDHIEQNPGAFLKLVEEMRIENEWGSPRTKHAAG